jgi:hypothetical protein
MITWSLNAVARWLADHSEIYGLSEASTPRVPGQLTIDTGDREGPSGPQAHSSFWSDRTAAIADAISAKLKTAEATRSIWKGNGDGYDTYQGDAWRDFPEFEELFTGELGDLLDGYFGSGFKIFRNAIYRTEHTPERTGSQLWHSDGGPGTCLNVMFYLHDVTPAHGALETLPWRRSMQVFRKELWQTATGKLDVKSARKRDNICCLYADEIAKNHLAEIAQPVGKRGLIVPFINNTIHRGGYPAAGLTRTAII